MAKAVQSIRFIGPAPPTGAGNLGALNRVLSIRGSPKVQEGAALGLKILVEEEARDLSGEAFSRFMDHQYERITSVLESSEVSKNLGALRAVDELINISIVENASKVSKFSNSMRIFWRYCRVFKATQDGLGRNAPIHSIHGSLLAVGELLRFRWA